MSVVIVKYPLILVNLKTYEEAMGQKAIEFTRAQNVPFYLAKYLLEYGKLQEEMGDVPGARESLAESLVIFKKLNNKEMMGEVTTEIEKLG